MHLGLGLIIDALSFTSCEIKLELLGYAIS